MFFNKKKNVLILGANGMLGNELYYFLLNEQNKKNGKIGIVSKLEHTPDNPMTIKSIYSFVDSANVHFDYVVNCAAITDTVGIEGDKKDISYEINALFVKKIAEMCKSQKSKLIHISTDYIFSENRPMSSSAGDREPFPINGYGMHKLLGEQFVQTTLEKNCYAILRVSWLYGKHLNKSFVHKFLKNCKRHADEGKYSVPCTADEYSMPTSCKNVCQQILNVINHNIRGIHTSCDKSGIGLTTISRYAFANEILMNFKSLLKDRNDDLYETFKEVVTEKTLMKSGVMRYPKDSGMPEDNTDGLFTGCAYWQKALHEFMAENFDALVHFVNEV